MDAIVIGGGIVGASCALHLAEAGAEVLVLERGIVGGGATAAGMGHLLVLDDSPAQLALTRASLELWRDLTPELPEDAEWDPAGTIWVAEREEEMEAARAKVRTLNEAGIEAELLDMRQLGVAEPGLREGLPGGVRVPGDAILYPPAAARYLMERARAAGAELIEGAEIEGIEPGTARVSGATFHARHVVLAAGAESIALLPGLPLRPRRGHLAITERYPGFCRHQLVELGYLASTHVESEDTPSVAFNVQPRLTGQLLVGSSRDFAGWDVEVDRVILGRMLRRAADFLPGLPRLRVVRIWTGFRPTTPDHLPLIGPWPGVEGLWVATGHEGLGITLAPITGRLIAAGILGSTPPIDPAPYAPERFFEAAGVGGGTEVEQGGLGAGGAS